MTAARRLVIEEIAAELIRAGFDEAARHLQSVPSPRESVAARRALIFAVCSKRWPKRPSEKTWQGPAKALLHALQSYAPGDWLAGDWANDHQLDAGCPHDPSSLESDLWSILKAGKIETMPRSIQGLVDLLREMDEARPARISGDDLDDRL